MDTEMQTPRHLLNTRGYNLFRMDTRETRFFRFAQFFSAITGIGLMISSREFISYPSYIYLIVTLILQSIWSMSMAALDFYAFPILINSKVFLALTVGDGILTLLIYKAVWASTAMNVMIEKDMRVCMLNTCSTYKKATILGILSWFTIARVFLANFAVGLDILFE